MRTISYFEILRCAQDDATTMTLPIHPPFPPMEAERAGKIPMQSKAGQPLARYFPEIVDVLPKSESRKQKAEGSFSL